LNPWGLLSFPACSHRGEGVKETLKAILGLTITHLLQMPTDASGGPGGPGASGGDSGQSGNDTGAVSREPSNRPLVNPIAVPTHVQADPADEGSGELGIGAGGGVGYGDGRPPIVVPVRIPRRAVSPSGTVRIVLEVQIDDAEGLLD
jgi:hypothetical protein